MGKTLNKLKDKNSAKTYTLPVEDKLLLVKVNGIVQGALDVAQNQIATQILHDVAVNKLGYAEKCDLRFTVDFEKEEDNFTITNVVK